jgi:hypothetical protein
MEEKTIKSRYTFVQKNTSLAHIKAEIISAVYRIVSTAQAFKPQITETYTNNYIALLLI